MNCISQRQPTNDRFCRRGIKRMIVSMVFDPFLGGSLFSFLEENSQLP
jgi:hypothetical protein